VWYAYHMLPAKDLQNKRNMPTDEPRHSVFILIFSIFLLSLYITVLLLFSS
jgi:hypothetical protein